MYEEQNETPFIVELSRSFTIIFTMTVLAMVLAGVLVARYAPETQDTSTLFVLKGMGLPYNTIFEIACLSVILAVFCVLIASGRFLVKMRFLSRFFLFLLAAFITTSLFVIVFKWLPPDDLQAWIGYTLSCVICFAVASGITLVNIKLQNKKYNRLLTNFKAHQRHKNIAM
jgi:hypothetical protein